MTSQRHRTQAANREATVARFAELAAVRTVRRTAAPTDPRPRVGARQHRLIDKRRQGVRKQERARPDGLDE